MASAKGQRQAAVYNAGLYNQNFDGTRDVLNTNADSALGAIGTGRTGAIDALQGNANSALGALGTGYDQARGDVTSGYGQARTDTQAGIDNFNPWVDSGKAANSAYSDFLGLNGAAASGAQQGALDTWRNATGYQDVVNSTTDAALRKASAIGGLGGNQIDELGRIGGQLANNTAQQYLGNLGTLSSQGLTAAGNQQAGYNNLANQSIGQGGALAGLATDQAGKEAGIYTNLGSSLGNVFQNAGQQQAGVYTGLGNSLNQLGQYTTTGITGGVTAQGQASDAAKQANQQTAINLGTSIFNAGTKLLGF
jgi:hypothetical protein